jgi:hypothetical protein
MAKQGYKIPASLDQTHLDRVISISNNPNSPIGLISLKTIVAYLGTAALIGVCWKLGMFKGNSIGFNIIYIILVFLFVSRLINTTKTGELAYNNLYAITDYLPKRMRLLSTTRNSNVDAFYKLYGIASIDDNNGNIRYKNGDFGTLLAVSGTGSILVFDEDKESILDANDAFWRKIDVGMYISEITIKEGQKVDLQLGNYQRRWNNLSATKMDLNVKNLIGDLMDAEVSVLADDIAVNYKSIHQYWLLRTQDKETLDSLKIIIKGEVDNSGLVIRTARTQYYNDIVRVSNIIFS